MLSGPSHRGNRLSYGKGLSVALKRFPVNTMYKIVDISSAPHRRLAELE